MPNNSGIFVNGLDAEEMIKFLDRKTKKYQAMLLDELETCIKDSEEVSYLHVRKLVLDYFNDYARSVSRLFFGDFDNQQS